MELYRSNNPTINPKYTPTLIPTVSPIITDTPTVNPSYNPTGSPSLYRKELSDSPMISERGTKSETQNGLDDDVKTDKMLNW